MVQQIASLKTESAAPALPFKLSVSAISMQSETRQSFDNEMLRQSRPSNVFEQPRQPKQPDVTNSQVAQTRNSVSRDSNYDREEKPQRKTFTVEKQDPQARADVQNSARQDQGSAAKSNDSIKSSTASSHENNKFDSGNTKHPIAKETDSIATQSESANTQISSNAKKDNGIADADADKALGTNERQEIFITESDLNSLKQKLRQSEGEALQDQFDYIDYVTQLAEFTSSKVEKNANDNLNSVKELSLLKADSKATETQGMPEVIVDNIKQVSIDELVPIAQNALEKNSNSDLLIEITLPSNQVTDENTVLSVAMSKQDLLKLVQIQESQLVSDKTLSAEEKHELSLIVDDLISQFEVLKTDPSGPISEEFTAANKDLLTSLLINSSAKSKANNENMDAVQEVLNEPVLVSQASTKETEKPSDASTLKQTNPQINSSVLAEKLNNMVPKNDTPESDKTSVNAQVLQVNTKQEELALDKNIKTADEDKKVDTSGFSLRNISQLNDQQTKAALENLSARVQGIASELSGESKGNEFVAALQSGVKEFKQQLAQGREPGIDLKAIVTEALAQVSGESIATQQPKIDAALNQFNALLNLANSVNHSASQQQAQILGLTDNQLAKEFNLQHIEGTKLANGIQNQLNAQAATDKAINIFKQDGQQQLAEKVRWMVNAKSATAEIRLDPPDLGGINIKVNLSGDIAQVNFNVQSAAAKEALDQAAPRLREMLQEQGIELGESVVQQESHNGQQGETSDEGDNIAKENSVGQDSAPASIEEIGSNIVEQRVSGSVLGGIDYYA